MKFKVGDKVKVVHNSNGSGIVRQAMNKIGIVKSLHNSSSAMIYVEFDDDVYCDMFVIGFFKDEIEKVVTKGQQLLFPFMSKQ